MLFTFIACDDPEPKTYTITIDYGYDNKIDELKNQTKLVKPETPVREGFSFQYWMIDGKEVTSWDISLNNDVRLTASWKKMEKVANLSDIPGVTFEQSTTDGYRYIVGEADGSGYIVTEWQDLWTNKDVTIKNVVFEQGVSLHTRNLEDEVTVTFDNCTVYACDQEVIIEKLKKNPNENYRMDNSGDGLCLGIDTNTSRTGDSSEYTGLVNVVVKNCEFIGASDPSEGYGSYRDQKNALAGTNKTDARGRGISLGLASGNTKYLKSASIENNTFEGIKCGGIQLFGIEEGTDITIKNNEFKSWGINSDVITNKTKTYYAVRGNLGKTSQGTVTLEGNTYAAVSGVVGDTRNLLDYRVAIDGFNQNEDDSYDQSVAK